MVGMRWQSLGLFLASLAAFGLGLGVHRTARAEQAGNMVKVMDTEAGRAALARAGVTAEQFKAMLDRMTPEQRAHIEAKALSLTPEARLTARMVAAGYSVAEAKERVAVLSGDEIVRLADDPNAVSSGAGAGAGIAIVVLVFLVILVVIYYAFMEEPREYESAPPAE
jgi:uncharacterized small protein (DUF1192 family)